MFTGIVEGTAEVTFIDRHNEWLRFAIRGNEYLMQDIAIGASISIDGVCLTVSTVENSQIFFDVIAESLARTTLGSLQIGTVLNTERSMKAGSEIGGHIMSGHIDGTIEVTALEASEGNHVLHFKVEANLRKYIFNKGFIGINGCSLTMGNVNKQLGTFTIWLIPETLKRTNLGLLTVGSHANIEVNRETQERVDTIIFCFQELLDANVHSSEQLNEARAKLLGGDV